MARLDLRPLSLGEILDRSFALYRQNFALFIGIAAIPQLFVLALNLAQTFLGVSSALPRTPASRPTGINFPTNPATVMTSVVLGIVGIIVFVVAYIWTQGATVSAVSDLYLGRSTTIGGSLRKVRGELGNLFAVGLLNGLVTGAAFILLIIPGIYMMCRLVIAVPAAVLEDLGPRASLERSFALTKDNAGRAFLILLLYFVLAFAAGALLAAPATIAMATARNNSEMMRIWMAITQILNNLASVLVTPILLISASVLYFDLRVRKEAFDLQVMMNPEGTIGPVTGGVPNALS